MSHENCQAACSALGYILSGTEYSGECWCDSILNNGGQPAPDGNALCNMPCNGNTTQHCGGPDRLDLYKYGIPSGAPGSSTTTSSSSLPTVTSSTSTSAVPTPSGTGPSGWTSLGCYTDSTAARALSVNSGVVGGPAAMSIEGCADACKAGGYTYSGTEYSGECWCGNALLNGHGPAPDGNAQCTMTCNGNALEICGGPSRRRYWGSPKFPFLDVSRISRDKFYPLPITPLIWKLLTLPLPSKSIHFWVCSLND